MDIVMKNAPHALPERFVWHRTPEGCELRLDDVAIAEVRPLNAGLVLRVPAGLGVLEAVGVALLATDALRQEQVLAALLAYRALYYFGPLVLAAVAFGVAELRWRQQAADEAPQESTAPENE